MTLGNDDFAVVLRRQLLRAGTGVAANYRAACRGRSDREFASKLATVVEEADESELWLDFLMERGYGPRQIIARLRSEAVELLSNLLTLPCDDAPPHPRTRHWQNPEP